MSWMSLSYNVHYCHDEEGGRASPVLPEVDEEDAAGLAAMATAARLGRGVENARSKEAKSSRSEMSQQGAECIGVLKNRVGAPRNLPYLNTGGHVTGRSEINGQT